MNNICPHCGKSLGPCRNPLPTVDTIIYYPGQGILLIKRRNFPHGWALPGGFVDPGESVEQAAIRETLEETGLEVELTGIAGVYSDPSRDPRQHTISTVFTAKSLKDTLPSAGDDAVDAKIFPLDDLPEKIAFDHRTIIADFTNRLKSDP